MGLKVILFVTAVLLGMAGTASTMPGGLSEEKVATPDVQALIDEVRDEVEEVLGFPLSRFKAQSFKTQVVAGLNYFVKVDAGDNSVVHIKVFHSLNGSNTLSSVKHFTDNVNRPIVYF